MDFIVVAIIVSLLTILYIWYVTSKVRSIKHLVLDSSEDKILKPWFDSNVKTNYTLDIDEKKVAALYLEKIHKISVNPKFIVVSEDLYSQCGKTEKIYYMRDTLGIDIEIAIIKDKILRDSIQQNDYDYQFVNNILSSDLYLNAKEYLTNLLKTRWKFVKKLEDPSDK